MRGGGQGEGNLPEAVALENKDLKMLLITDISSMAPLRIQQDPESPGSSPQASTFPLSTRAIKKKICHAVIGRKSQFLQLTVRYNSIQHKFIQFNFMTFYLI